MHHTSSIPLLKTGILPSLISNYLSANVGVKQFYNLPPTLQNFGQQLQHKKQNYTHRAVLVEVLKQQYANLQAGNAVANNIHLLQQENTFTVTTAHQTNVFTGPLYYVYKILHVIKLAATLKQHYADYNFVPVYWMGSEDHDFEEINHIYVFGEKIEWTHNAGGATGRLNPKSLLQPLAEIKNKLSNEPFAQEIISLFEKGYAQHNMLATATQYILNELFGKYGLLVLNADEPKLKQLFAKVIEAELTQQIVHKHTAETIAAIEQLGYKPQASPREINLFYLAENIRERILLNENGEYEVLNTSLKFSKEEMLQMVSTNAEKFSPNVFLRPLYQETILPNLAYVGGSGELSYWLEQKSIFNYFNVPFPILMQRNSFLLADTATQKKIQKLQLPITAYFADEDSLIKEYISANSNLPDFEEERNRLQQIFQHIKEKTAAVDITLQATVEAQLQQAMNSLDNLEKKIVKAEKNKQDVAINQLKAVRSKLFPNNVFQERYENLLPYYAKYGNTLIDTIFENIQPVEAALNIVDLT